MGPTQWLVAGAGLLFLLVLLSGLWLYRSGKPFPGIILTVHKLVSLGAAACVVIAIYQMSQVAALSAIEASAGVASGVLFLATVASGGLLSTAKPMPGAVLLLHRITPFLTVLATAIILYLLLSRT